MIGPGAGRNSKKSGSTVALGHDALTGGNYVYNAVAVGDLSFGAAKRVMIANAIGYKAGSLSTEVDYGNFIGSYAGSQSSGVNESVFIGKSAGKLSFDADQSFFAGLYAGEGSSGVKDSIILGTHAMRFGPSYGKGTPVQNSIAIGEHVGGQQNADSIARRRLGSWNLILEPDAAHERADLWASDYDDYIVSIGSIIHGYSTAMRYSDSHSSIARHLMLGKQPSSLLELQEATVTVKPELTSKIVLKLNRTASHTNDMLQADIQNDGYSVSMAGDTQQTIINKHGYLQLPVARYSKGGNLYDDTGQKIPNVDGVICVLNMYDGTTAYNNFGHHTRLHHIKGFAVRCGNRWRFLGYADVPN